MTVSPEPQQIILHGVSRRAGVAGAVLALNGAGPRDLRRACAMTAAMTDRLLLVAVDGGLDSCVEIRRRPDLFVGDGDSAFASADPIESIHYPRDKDFSDLAGALKEVSRRGVQVVGVAGLVGGRLDHEWANLLELGSWSPKFAGILAPSQRGTVLITSHGCRVATVRRRTVSLLALGASASVTLTGTRWELDRQRLRPGSLGLSNVSGARLELTVHRGSVALVFLPAQRRARRA